jgi:hypothetical protein
MEGQLGGVRRGSVGTIIPGAHGDHATRSEDGARTPLSEKRTPNGARWSRESRASRPRLRAVVPRTSPGLLASLLPAIVLLATLLPHALAAQSPPPNQAWQTFQTPSFQVVFPPELEAVAFRAAERAEWALSRLEGFGRRPPGRIQLLVTDHVDLSNGFASAAPYPRITIWTRPAVTGPGAMPFDDWLELVVTHEVVHILHLEMTGPLGQEARRLLGRPAVGWPHFPAFLLPAWAVEGVAVEAESSLTGGGRVHGARFEAMARARLLGGERETLAQVMGPSPLFPGGERPYTWGGLFFHHLAETRGEAAVGAFFRSQAERLNPLRLNASARDAFGSSLEELHEGWLDQLEAQARHAREAVRARGLAPEPEPLTEGARMALHPTFRPSDGALAWVRSDGRSEAGVFLGMPGEGLGGVAAPGANGAASPVRPGEEKAGAEGDVRRLAPLHLVAPVAFGPGDTLWTAQPEFDGRYEIRGELWKVSPRGERTRVTRGLRAAGLDVHPESGRIVAVLDVPGTNQVVELDSGGRVVSVLAPPDPGVHWSHPRWSPDGREVALTRWDAGGRWGVVVLSPGPDAGAPWGSRVLHAGPAPADGATWSPDGRWVLFSSERSGVSNLYAVATAGGGSLRQLTDLVTAGIFPVVTPQADAVLFSHLGPHGWELARIPFDPQRWFDPLPVDPRHLEEEGSGRMTGGGHLRAVSPTERSPVVPWSPVATLLPRHWLPSFREGVHLGEDRVLAPRVGARTGATDLVGRNRWEAELLLPAGGPGRGWEALGSWSWAGLGNPVLSVAAEQRWDATNQLATPEDGPPLNLAFRDRSALLQAQVARPGFRESQQATLGARLIRSDRFLLEDGGGISSRARLLRPTRDFAELSLGLTRSTVRGYAFQPGPQEGTQLSIRLRNRWELALPDSLAGIQGQDGELRDLIFSTRHFRPLAETGRSAAGGAPPVLGLRGAVGVAGGPGAGPTTLRVGGGGGGGSGTLGATWDATPGVFQVRGFQAGARGGDRAWGAGGELRVPVEILNRGVGVLPLYLDRLAVGGWVDAGGAEWEGAYGGTLLSTGAELMLAHGIPDWTQALFRVGVAVPLQGRIPDPGTGGTGGGGVPSPSVYAAVGWGF